MFVTILLICYVTVSSGVDPLNKPHLSRDSIDGAASPSSDDTRVEKNMRHGLGTWTDWLEHACSVTCGNGVMRRTRECTNKDPRSGNDTCIGIYNELQICIEAGCPDIDGGWTNWVSGSCSVTCGNGTNLHSRNCTNPTPEGGGQQCVGSPHMNGACSEPGCQVHGGWSSWTVNACSVHCGSGIATKSRNCSNPPPANGGNKCPGQDQELIACTQSNCPVDGEWASWTEVCLPVYRCRGIKARTRLCNNPRPVNGGNWCQGNDIEQSLCTLSAFKQQGCVGYGMAWMPISEKCVYVSDVGKKQSDAIVTCKEMCGNLIRLNNVSMVQELQLHSQAGQNYWIDGSDAAHEGSWIDSTGNNMWTTWASEQPNGGSSQNCVYINGQKFYDNSCATSLYYICEVMSG